MLYYLKFVESSQLIMFFFQFSIPRGACSKLTQSEDVSLNVGYGMLQDMQTVFPGTTLCPKILKALKS